LPEFDHGIARRWYAIAIDDSERQADPLSFDAGASQVPQVSARRQTEIEERADGL
jgi:hypothetical protein